METAQSSVAYETLSLVSPYLHAAATALIAYEYAITLDLEVNLFWKRRVTMTSILFAANRYLPLIVVMLNAPYPTQLITLMGNRCSALRYTATMLAGLQYIPWAVFAALRTYVLSSKSGVLALVVFLLHIVAPVSNYINLSNSLVFAKFGRCELLPILSFPTENLLIIVTRICLVVSDLLVVGVTWNTTYRTTKEMRAFDQRTTLSETLLRDGVLYFLILQVTNAIHLTFTLLSITSGGENCKHLSTDIVIILEPIAAVIFSRFLIDLQQVNVSDVSQETVSGSSMASMAFRVDGFIGSLGSSLPAPGRLSWAGEHGCRGTADLWDFGEGPATASESRVTVSD